MRISDWSSDVCSSDLGTGGFSVLEQPEVTVTYEQRIERGGKREARLAYASRGLDLAEAQARLRRLELAQQVQRAFIDVQIAARSEVRRVGKGGGSTCRSRGWPYY